MGTVGGVTRAVAVIPARWASVRFPGKALVVIRGKPLVQHVWERARELETVERVVVATDDEVVLHIPTHGVWIAVKKAHDKRPATSLPSPNSQPPSPK